MSLTMSWMRKGCRRGRGGRLLRLIRGAALKLFSNPLRRLESPIQFRWYQMCRRGVLLLRMASGA
jgi:hypothetical protein